MGSFLAEAISPTLSPVAGMVGSTGLFVVALGLLVSDPLPRLRWLFVVGTLCAGVAFAVRVAQALGTG